MEPLQPVGDVMAEPHKLIRIDESAPTPLLEFEAPQGCDTQQVRDHLEVTDAITSRLDVTERVLNSHRP